MTKTMDKVLVAMVALAILIPAAAHAANITGEVQDTRGKPIEGVKVEVLNNSGKVIGASISDSAGHYSIGNLAQGNWPMRIDPMNTLYKGVTNFTASLTSDQIAVKWVLSISVPALAYPTNELALKHDRHDYMLQPNTPNSTNQVSSLQPGSSVATNQGILAGTSTVVNPTKPPSPTSPTL